MNVFTYGTLMFPEVWTAVVGREYPTVTAEARGFAVYRLRNEVYPGMVPADPEAIVAGVLHERLEPGDVQTLDAFEVPFYERIAIDVRLNDGRHCAASAWIIQSEHRRLLTNEPWQPDEFVAGGDLERFLQTYRGFQQI